MPQFDVAYVRSQFPALKRTIDGHPVAYFDAPGGTQTPQSVADAVAGYLLGHNSNTHGCFAASMETDAIIDEARRAAADFLGCEWAEVSFGANMTTLNYALAAALAGELKPGDEVVITALDHEANRGPWLRLAEKDVVVREVPVDLATCTLDWDTFEAIVKPGKTKIVALGYASNAVGTVNDVARAARLARAAGAFSVVDAVHYALHGPIDVAAIGCDFLLCSAYKFFGPHIGLLYARRAVTSHVEPLRLATQEQEPPYIWETGHAGPRRHRRHGGGHRLHRRHGRAQHDADGGPRAGRSDGPPPLHRRRHARGRSLRTAPRPRGCASSWRRSPA